MRWVFGPVPSRRLGRLPPEAQHCALLAANTLRAAIADYREGTVRP
jgi:hypothetical protein